MKQSRNSHLHVPSNEVQTPKRPIRDLLACCSPDRSRILIQIVGSGLNRNWPSGLLSQIPTPCAHFHDAVRHIDFGGPLYFRAPIKEVRKALYRYLFPEPSTVALCWKNPMFWWSGLKRPKIIVEESHLMNRGRWLFRRHGRPAALSFEANLAVRT